MEVKGSAGGFASVNVLRVCGPVKVTVAIRHGGQRVFSAIYKKEEGATRSEEQGWI